MKFYNFPASREKLDYQEFLFLRMTTEGLKLKIFMLEKNKKESGEFPIIVTIKTVILKDDKVLLLQRNKKNLNGGKWDLPGGWLEEGELFKDCLKREILEETNIEVDIDKIISTAEFSKDKKYSQDKKGLRYLAYYKSGEVKLNKREHTKFEWSKIEDAITKLSDEGFEKEKKDTIVEAQKYLEMKDGVDNWKRCLADFENYKKMQAKSQKDIIKYSTENIIMQILPVIDNFESSIAHIPDDEESGGWVQGIMYIKKQLENVIKENGIEEIKVKTGDEFDATKCEAVEQEASSKKRIENENKISKVVLKGYKIGDKIIRPAKVIVK